MYADRNISSPVTGQLEFGFYLAGILLILGAGMFLFTDNKEHLSDPEVNYSAGEEKAG